jgi:predicted double-glycine peptidase
MSWRREAFELLPEFRAIVILCVGVLAGVTRSRRLLRSHHDVVLASAHRHLQELVWLTPFVFLATLATIILLRFPRVAWCLPPTLDYWRDWILWILSSGFFSYLAGMVLCVAYTRRDAHRGILTVVCIGILAALTGLYAQGTWPVAGQLRTKQTPDGYVLQSSAYSCCAASMANVARALGLQATEPQMARLAGTTRAGTSTGQALHALTQVGIQGSKRTMSSDELRRVPTPCILLVEFASMGADSHAVMYLPSTNQTFRIIDPLYGPQDWSVDHLNGVWIGHTIVCEKPGR